MAFSMYLDSTTDSPLRSTVRPKLKKGNPLALSPEERASFNRYMDPVVRRMSVQVAASYPQIQALYSAMTALAAALKADWPTLCSAAVDGLDAIDRVTAVSFTLISQQDGAQRERPVPERAEFQTLALRLSMAEPLRNPLHNMRAQMIRASVHAIIAIDRGILHVATQNLGAIAAAVAGPDSLLADTFNPSDDERARAVRHARAVIKMP